MAIICPTVTAYNPHEFREQIERVAPFADRIHVDFMDGDFASPQSVSLTQAWLPGAVRTDLHLMYRYPTSHLELAINLKPDLIILHAEAEGDFASLSRTLKAANIKVGLALLQDSSVAKIKNVLADLDVVLIFSGHLGHHGGKADLSLLTKVHEIKAVNPALEIGWDGGVDATNAAQLVAAGVDVLNVGAAIHQASDPANAYAKLKQIAAASNG